MRIMPIQVFTGSSGIIQLRAAFSANWKHYLREALGIALFMMSACYFGALLYAENAFWNRAIQDDLSRSVSMGVLMGLTALFIFYSPFTAPSGSHINPAVTITFLRLGKMCRYDALFYILAQFAGGAIAVMIMQNLVGAALTAAPVCTVVTVPGPGGIWPALWMEFLIAFITMTMVLFTSGSGLFKKYTRIFAGCLVCTWVIVAGPISGFGMNPARSFASALPADIWTAFWIYMLAPVAGMLCAAEMYLHFGQTKK